MKTKIICIVGPSGCGKTSMVKFIEKELGVPYLVSYTTRPKRKEEVDGVDHYFVDVSEMPPKEQMLAYTYFGSNHYWTDLKDLPENGTVMYVIDEAGLLELQKNYSARFDIKTILIKRDRNKLIEAVGEQRVKRDIERMDIDESQYDAIIKNNGSLLEFYKTAKYTIKSILS